MKRMVLSLPNRLPSSDEPAALLVVGVPDPLADVGQPALASLLLDHADEVEVGERVLAAEDLADHADERPGGVVVGGHRAEAVAGAQHGRDDGLHALLVRDALHADRSAGVLEALLVHRVRGALLALVGPCLEQELHEDVLRQHGPPGGAHEVLGVVADRRVPVARGDADHRDVAVAELVELAADEVQVLPEPARPVGRRHEEGDVVAALVLDDAQEVAEHDLLRVALVARGHATAEVEGALVGVGGGPGVEADGADGGGQQVRAAVRHLRQVQLAALHPRDRLLDASVLDVVRHAGVLSRRCAARLGRHRPPPRGTRALRRPRPGTTSAGSPCCRGTPRSGSWRRRRSGARRTAGSGTACPTPHARSA